VLSDLQADVIGLQEVWAAAGKTWRGGWRTVSACTGPGRHLAHPDDGKSGSGTSLSARIETLAHQVPFFTTHLTSAIDASEVRCRQVAVLAEVVTAHSHGTDFPPVVTGDFNAWPDSDEVRQFGGYKTSTRHPRPGLPRRLGVRRSGAAVSDVERSQPVRGGRVRPQRPHRRHPRRSARSWGSWSHRDHPEREDRLRRQQRLGHSHPVQHRAQLRRCSSSDNRLVRG
jgi:endonuclease/exonuclease/phosphatase family metal-dependent hydrolase